MGLSEQERKIFDEIEQHLTEEDPRFVDKARKRTPEAQRGRRLKLAAVAIGVGFLLLLGLVESLWFGAVGFGLMFLGVVVGANELQNSDGDLGRRFRSMLDREDEDV
jgi:hypothetical protein